ncbi:MAG TPA: TIGR00282 family metallophosphoesterase [Fimbriimonas sp.]|nr:TIGR00282 family metallophosphoesterase [Fimbriimonas sp.]
MNEYSILFLGDVVGRPGRTALKESLPKLQILHKPLFTIINGENSAGGLGITSSIAEEFFALGADAITLGNHTFNKREIEAYLNSGKPIVRPHNMLKGLSGKGIVQIQKGGVQLAVINLSGRVMMDPVYDDPFNAFDEMVAQLQTKHIFVDFHAEATSEKIAFGYHCDGLATAVVGTHTHVTTADERVLPGGTAYITDVGMCGPENSVLGMDKNIILRRFRTGLPEKFEVANEPGVISGVVICVEKDTGRAKSIVRIRV